MSRVLGSCHVVGHLIKGNFKPSCEIYATVVPSFGLSGLFWDCPCFVQLCGGMSLDNSHFTEANGTCGVDALEQCLARFVCRMAMILGGVPAPSLYVAISDCRQLNGDCALLALRHLVDLAHNNEMGAFCRACF